MLRHKFITQEDEKKVVEDPPILEDINDIIKSTVNYIMAHDKVELMELLENLKGKAR